MIKGAEIVVKTLIEQGVDTLFGYPGGAVLGIFDVLYDYKNEIKNVITVHEQGAAHAAEGYAKSTGKVGVAIATSGPGATNLVTGIADAYLDSVPTVFITGNAALSQTGRDSFQEIYIAGVTMPITKHNFVVKSVHELASTIRDAFRIANSGRKGPVLIDIPKDIVAQYSEFTPKEPFKEKIEKYNDEKNMMDFIDVINKSQKPVIYCGGGVILSGATNELREFISKARIPACNTIMGTGILGNEDELHLGMVGMHGKESCNLAIEHCDLLLAIGVRFSDRVALNVNHFAPNAKIIHIDIDASEINKNINVDYSVVGDVKDILLQIMPFIKKRSREEWIESIKKWQEEDYKPLDNNSVIKPHQLVQMISKKIGEDGIIVTDVGQHQMWAAQYSGRSKSRRFLTSGGLGTMGFGYGAAIGAKIANPSKKVVHITGDGSFHMNMNECITAVSNDLDIISVVFNNQSLGMVRQWQHYFYDDRYSQTDLFRKVDYVKFAQALGANGYMCENIVEFEKAFDEALESSKVPTIIDCKIGRDEKVLPLIPPNGTVDNMIVKE